MRSLSPGLLIAAAAVLSACNPSQTSSVKQPVSSMTPAPEPPTLWSIQAQNDQGKAIKTVLICADAAVHESFLRPLPSPNGQPCRLVMPAVKTGGRFAARCKSDGRLLDIQAESTGDPARDFVVKLLIQSDVAGKESLEQTLHYRRLGACPDGWATGDAAAPGDRRTVNSVSGVVRELNGPVRAPAP